jgi:hypothetical protein
MNRALVIPAIGCALAFSALLAGFRATQTQALAVSPTPSDTSAPIAAASISASRMSSDDAEQMLTALTGEYLRPWKRWENAREYNYSRASVGPVPTMESRVQLQPLASKQSDACLLATITLTAGKQSQTVPCVVDRDSRRVSFFADGKWLTREEWVQQAPIPWRGKWSRASDSLGSR